MCVHITLVLMLALPVPAITPDELDKEGVQAWFDRTHAKLLSLGIQVDRQAMVDSAAVWGGRYSVARDIALVPGNAYASWTGAKQSWRMFSNISHGSARFMVERLDDQNEWHPVYVGMDFDHDWQLDFFQQERVRTLVNNYTHKKSYSSYKRLGRFLLVRLKQDFPDSVGFRTVMQEVHFPPPETLAKTGTLEFRKRYWGKRLEPKPEPTPPPAAKPAKPNGGSLGLPQRPPEGP